MSKLDYTFRRDHVFLGTTAHGARVLITGALYRQGFNHQPQTIHHETVDNPEHLGARVVAFTGRKNIYRNLANGLHSLDYFGPKITAPAPGYTMADVRELVTIGLHWHNNTLRPGCAHMIKPAGDTPRERLDAGVTCPITGQKWGSARYTEPLPDEIRDRFIALMEQGRTEDADY